MNNTDEMSFIDRLKEGNIHSNKASIEVHRNMIVDNLEYIEKNNENILTPLTKEYLNKLKNIEEKEI
jgi:predicted Rossmann fold nucleotide-binding protein DprA/Smf involved in DNA uptake